MRQASCTLAGCAAALLLLVKPLSAEDAPAVVHLTPAEAAQLTPEGLSNLQRLVERVRRGALGNDVDDATFRPSYQGLSSDGAIRFEIWGKSGGRAGFMLLRPPLPGPATPPRYFVLFPDDDVAPAHVKQLAAVLDDVFRDNPWSGDPRSYQPHWHLEGAVGDPVSRARAACGIVFLVVSTLAGVLFLLCVHPRSGAERLFGACDGRVR